ncbi:hypothetical protein [Microtetraspora fusca]|uniref:hypothetical protein n=1 Tax=Microtetraspora fusca TaxID=1997 RepID=UPI000831D2C0|nr:hypothetical protein [Microtetraspora fusca]
MRSPAALSRSLAAVLALPPVLLLVLALSPSARAAASAAPTPGPGRPAAEGFQEGRTAGVRLRNSSIVLSGNGLGGGGARGDGYRIPRPCWYEPYKNADEMVREQDESLRHALRADPDLVGAGGDTDGLIQKYRDKLGQEGRWWRPSYNEADPNGVACAGALAPAVWVPNGQTPPAGITPEDLLQIARAALTVPEPKLKLSPDARSFVNLPTWVWLDGAGPVTRSVTATLPGVMSATVTATLKNIEIDAGTTSDRAEVRQNCGATGHPYAKGGDFTCGVRYLRASIDLPRQVYTMTVTAVWPVTGAVGQGGAPIAYTPLRATVTRDVPVGEVQSVVTG